MWLCKSIKKERKKEKIKKRGSKRWTSAQAIKTTGTLMPASHSNEKKRIKIAHGFPRHVLSFKGGSNFQRAKVEMGLATKYYICTYPPYSIPTH